jgi:hypothetical protein
MTKCRPDKNKNCLLLEDRPDIRLVRTNYCVPGVMSRCSAGALWDDQKKMQIRAQIIGSPSLHVLYRIDWRALRLRGSTAGIEKICGQTGGLNRQPSVDRQSDTVINKKPPGSPHTTRG